MPETVNQPKPEKSDKKAASPADTQSHSAAVWVTIWTILLIASIAGTGYFMSGIPKKAKAIQVLRSQAISMTMSSQDTALLQKALHDTKTWRDELANAFPTETTLVRFLQLMDSLKQRQVNVHFSVDSDMPTKIGRNPSFLPMTLTLRGDRPVIEHILQLISDSPYLIRTVRYQVTFDQSGGNMEVQTNFQLFVSDTFGKTKPVN